MKSKNDIEAFILCGGQSRRMSRNKSFIHWKGKSFLEWSIEAIKPIAHRITLVTNDPVYLPLGLPIIQDLFPGKGPSAGIHAALNASEHGSTLILSCDCPMITSDLIRFLLDQSLEKDDVTYLRKDKVDYPLIGIYQKRMAHHFKKNLINGNNRLMKIIQTEKYKALEIPHQYYDQVQNINTPGDFAALENIVI